MPEDSIQALNILLIDDQRAMRSILRNMLHRIGIKDTAEANDGREALDYLGNPQARFPDVIICDLHMEGMDGMQFCQSVRRHQKYRNSGVPILILTGDHDPLLHEVSRQVGAVSVLTKPVNAQQLKSEIVSAVGYAEL